MEITIDSERVLSPVFEVAEHKGLGHPDSICDAVAEASTRALSRAYLDRFGRVLHHNVDKALLVGGASRPRFGGGEVLRPIEIDVAGRVTASVGGEHLDVDQLVAEACDRWLRGSMHELDVDRHVVVRPRLRAGSIALRDLFDRRDALPLANDTSCGAAYAPATLLDRVVLAIADRLKSAAGEAGTPWIGEDVKVMGVRRGRALDLTVACAIVDRHVRDVTAYREAIDALASMARAAARAVIERTPDDRVDDFALRVNAADDPARERVYLTVTGTSAEAGDDGEVGRGNRINRLITPGRAMTLEAAAGKNPVTHVGKLYSVAARVLAERIVGVTDAIVSADVVLVSCIGAPVDDPRLAHVRLRTRDGGLDERTRGAVQAEVRAAASSMSGLTARILAGEIDLF